MTHSPSVLVVDDEPGMLRYLQTVLEADSYQVETARSGTEALARVERDPLPNVVLLDLLMPEVDGLRTLELLRQARPDLKVVMLSCVSDPRKVVQAIRLGAADYLTKPFQKADLDAVLKHSMESGAPVSPAEDVSAEVEELGEGLCFVAASPVMRKLRAQIDQVAKVDVPVLLLGESGTGKEVVARLIHKLSLRAGRTFLKVNCAAIPGELLESELFGYEAGGLPAPRNRNQASSSFAIKGPFCSTRSANCRSACKRNCFTSFRISNSRGWAAGRRSAWTCGFWLPPTWTSRQRSPPRSCARTSTIA